MVNDQVLKVEIVYFHQELLYNHKQVQLTADSNP